MDSVASLARSAERLEELQSQISVLNDALQEILDVECAVPPRRRHARMRAASGPERLQFRQQALKLAIYAPY